MGPGKGAQREVVIIPALFCKINMRIWGVCASENAFGGGIFYIKIPYIKHNTKEGMFRVISENYSEKIFYTKILIGYGYQWSNENRKREKLFNFLNNLEKYLSVD